MRRPRKRPLLIAPQFEVATDGSRGFGNSKPVTRAHARTREDEEAAHPRGDLANDGTRSRGAGSATVSQSRARTHVRARTRRRPTPAGISQTTGPGRGAAGSATVSQSRARTHVRARTRRRPTP